MLAKAWQARETELTEESLVGFARLLFDILGKVVKHGVYAESSNE